MGKLSPEGHVGQAGGYSAKPKKNDGHVVIIIIITNRFAGHSIEMLTH